MRKFISVVCVILLLMLSFSLSSTALAEPLKVVINLDKASVAVGDTVKVTWQVTGDLAPNQSLLGYWCTSNEEDSNPDPIEKVGSDSFVPQLTGNLFFEILVWNEDDSTYKSYTSEHIPITKPGSSSIGTPINVNAISASYNSIKLSWKTVFGAAGYIIYRATSKTGTYTKTTSVSGGSKNTYTNTGLTTGKEYYYKVCAYKKVNGSNACGKFSSVVSAKPSLFKLSAVKAASASHQSIKLTWKTVSGADGYIIYRATSSTGKYSKIAMVSGGKKTYYTNTGLTAGKAYYYKICAYKKVSGKYINGSLSNVVTAKVK